MYIADRRATTYVCTIPVYRQSFFCSTSDQSVEFIFEKFYSNLYELSLYVRIRVIRKKQIALNILLALVIHYVRTPLRGASFAIFANMWLLKTVIHLLPKLSAVCPRQYRINHSAICATAWGPRHQAAEFLSLK